MRIMIIIRINTFDDNNYNTDNTILMIIIHDNNDNTFNDNNNNNRLASVINRSVITVGFHNFNLRTFNLRVSNPNKLIVDVFLTRCRISMCQGLGPTKTR